MDSILAGVLIALGCVANLSLGGITGAICFSFALVFILMFDLRLFTGRVGCALDGSVKWRELGCILAGNAYGVIMTAAAIALTPLGATLAVPASAIISSRLAAGALGNVILGGCCGICVAIAVEAWKNSKNIFAVMLSVATFVVCGFGHCIADLGYACFANEGWLTVCATGIGNVLGSWLFYMIKDRRIPLWF